MPEDTVNTESKDGVTGNFTSIPAFEKCLNVCSASHAKNEYSHYFRSCKLYSGGSY